TGRDGRAVVAARPGLAAPSPTGLEPLPPLAAPWLAPLPLQPAGFEPVPVLYTLPSDPAPAEPTRAAPVRAAIGHSLLLAAGLSQMELPPALLAYLQDAAARPGVPAAAPSALAAPALAAASSTRRWSADGWLLLRRDAAAPLLSGRPSYGRSQAGSVVRYSLAPSSPRRPLAYLRASAALAGARDREVSAGLSARPLPGVPLRVAAEARAGQTDRGTRLRPAAY